MTANSITPAQRTPEWFAQRRAKLTGSNIGAALGVNPYMTPSQLLRRMVRDYHGADSEFKDNIATEYGTLHEPIAILDYTIATGLAVHEAGFITSQTHEWLGASPDGFVVDSCTDNETGETIDELAVLEIKCPFSQRDTNPPVFKTALEQPHYYAQMQIEMYCAQASKAHFWQWSKHGHSLEIVSYNRAWIAENLPKLEAFYQQFLKEIDNPAHLEPPIPEITSAKASVLLAEYDATCKALDEATELKKSLLAEIVALANGKDANKDAKAFLICGRKLSLIKREGAISYAKAVKDLLPDADLSKYQSAPTEFWKLS